MQKLGTPNKIFEIDDWIGMLLVFLIGSLWCFSLAILLTISVSNISWFWLVFSILGRTYLHTGLFILAHDSMHGNLIPCSRSLNNIIGRFAVGIYAFLPYDHCFINHHHHHRYSAQIGDPDFHGSISHPIFWYVKFIREYLPMRSLITFLIKMSFIIAGLTIIFNIPLINIILFWLLPLILSSSQLFFFGTYLPHRQTLNNSNFSPRLNNNLYSILWSLISCYNFGHYHWEHHEYPQLPWYRLHTVHRASY